MRKNILIWLLVVALSSCDDFLTEVPNTAVPEKDAMTDLASAEEVCLGVYSTFKNPSLYSGTMIQAPEVQSDLFYAAKGYSNRFGNFYRWEVNANEAALLDVYYGLYQIVNRCNFFLDHEDEVRDKLTKKEDKAAMDKYTADVCFMRAYAYSDLIRIFCEAYESEKAATTLGVPIYLHYREGDGATVVKGRASLEESYAQVLADLDRAELLEPRKGCDTPFITQGAVLALRARVLLNMCRWEEAEEYATKVIEQKAGSGPTYELADASRLVATVGGTMSEYEYMWKYDSADEIIWKIAFSTTDMGGSLGALYMSYTSGRYNPNYLPANWLLDSYFTGDQRYTTFFTQTTTMQGLQWEVLTKFPGNPDIDGTVGMYFVNMPKLLRLSETYLIRAEARCMQGKTAKACEDLTTLRKCRVKNYGTATYDASKLLDAIQKERALELVGEGFRLTDLKRWHKGFERTVQPGTIDGPNYNQLKVQPDNPRFTWLIPQHEITASKGEVVQNK